MDRAAAKAEMTEDGRSERLLITEEEGRDVSEAVGGGDVTEQIAGGPSALRRDDGQVGEGVNAGEPSKQRAGPEGGQEAGGRRRTGEEDGADRRGRTENKGEDGQSGDVKERGQPPEEEEEEKRESAAAGNGAGAEEDVASTSGRRLDADGRAPSEEPDRETPRQLEAGEQAHRLTPEFPEALYELLCTLQEGRRLNDQRCSFRLEAGMRRRRCHSEPNTSKPTQRVFFSSTTSLQREEFFELVAAAQARRLNDQRAELQTSPPRRTKAKSFRGSIRQLSIMRRAPPAPAPAPAPVPAPKEELYDMILTTQAQGRLEDQRSRAPGPMDDEDFFSLLLRVQGGRMEEQRTELPHILQT